MRGLTDEERTTLERWRRREYESEQITKGDIVRELFARGLASWEELDDGCHILPLKRAVPTPLGELALRVDAAARAKGVWP